MFRDSWGVVYARKYEVGKKKKSGRRCILKTLIKGGLIVERNRGGMQWRTTIHPDIACTLCINYVNLFSSASNQKSVSERPMGVCLDSRARAEVKVSIKRLMIVDRIR